MRLLGIHSGHNATVALMEDGRILGYSYAGKWKDRSAYRHTVEATIYLAPEAAGRLGHARQVNQFHPHNKCWAHRQWSSGKGL